MSTAATRPSDRFSSLARLCKMSIFETSGLGFMSFSGHQNIEDFARYFLCQRLVNIHKDICWASAGGKVARKNSRRSCRIIPLAMLAWIAFHHPSVRGYEVYGCSGEPASAGLLKAGHGVGASTPRRGLG